MLSCGALLSGAVSAACGGGTLAGAAAAGGGGGKEVVVVVPTSATVATPDDGQAGIVRVAYRLQIGAGQRARLDGATFSLSGAAGLHRAATPIAGFPTDLVPDAASLPPELGARDTVDAAELERRGDAPLCFAWNSGFDLDALLRSGAIARPATARAVLRLAFTNLDSGERVVVTTDEFFLDHGLVSSFAGGGVVDGLDAQDAAMLDPTALALAPDGALLVADSGTNRLRVLRRGEPGAPLSVATLAGNGFGGVLPGLQPALRTSLGAPSSVAAIGGAVFAVEERAGRRVVRVLDGATGLLAQPSQAFGDPSSVATDGEHLFVADAGDGRVLRFSVAGQDPLASGLEPSAAVVVAAQLAAPSLVALSPAGPGGTAVDVFVVESPAGVDGDRVLRLAGGAREVVAGGGALALEPVLLAAPRPATDFALAVTGLAATDTHLFLSDARSRSVLVVDRASDLATHVVADVPGATPDRMADPRGLAHDGESLFVADAAAPGAALADSGHRVLRVDSPESPGAAAVPEAGEASLKALVQAVPDLDAQEITGAVIQTLSGTG